jgi:hypothetical protein
VNGNVVESGTVVEFGNPDDKSSFSMLPVDLFYRFQNTGNDRLTPKGNVTIKNMFGMTKETLDANVGEGSALPGGVRRYDVSWDPKGYGDSEVGFFGALGRELSGFSLGRYTAELEVSYGVVSPQSASASYSFWMFPWRTLLMLLIVILVVVGVWMWVKKSKKANVKQ